MANGKFGETNGVVVGRVFADRAALVVASVHYPLQADIRGSGQIGAESIVVSGGCEDKTLATRVFT